MFITAHAPFALLSLMAMAICAGVGLFAWRRRRSVAGAAEFAWLMGAVAWMSFFGAADYLLSASNLDLKLLVNQLYVLGGAFAAMSLLLFVLRYTHRDHWLSWRGLVLLWAILAAGVLILLTNDWHHLYWSAITVDPLDPAAPVVYAYGPLNRLLAVYIYGLALFAASLLLYSAIRAPALYRWQYTLMVVALTMPVLAHTVYYVRGDQWRNFDLTPVAYCISGCLMAWAMFRHQFLDLAPLAQDALFANLGDGVIAINARGQIVAANPAARRLLGASERALIGTAVATLAPPWGDALGNSADAANHEYEVNAADRTIAISPSPLTALGGRSVGRIFLLHDVTARRILEDELVKLNGALEERVAVRTSQLQQTVAQLQAEIEERQRAEATLRHMQESLASHVTGLSRQISVLYEIILLGGRALDLPAVRHLTLATIVDALQADAGIIFAYRPEMPYFELAAQQGLAEADVAQLLQLDAGWLFADPSPHTILQFSAADMPPALQAPGMQACVLANLIHLGTPTGAVGLFWREQPSLNVESIALLRALVDQLAVLSENVRLRSEREQALVQEERKRLARDLHDSVTQSLYALTLSADTALARLRKGDTARLAPLMERIAMAANQALREIRLLLYELRLATPDAMPLAEALQLRLDAVEKRAGIDATLTIAPDLTVTPPVAQALYWIAVEALNNALKHAAAHRVAVNISQTAAGIELSVCDDGVGMAPHAADNGGYGLRGMAERAAQHGGVLTLATPPAGGTQVLVRLPPPSSTTHQNKAAGLSLPAEVSNG